MESRDLGATELGVSVFGLGTMTFGAESDEATSHSILDHYFEHGGRFVDTADVYSRGASEEIVGRWLARRSNRDQIVLTTKARFPMGDGPEWSGAGRDYLPRALDASLRRLQPIILTRIKCTHGIQRYRLKKRSAFSANS